MIKIKRNILSKLKKKMKNQCQKRSRKYKIRLELIKREKARQNGKNTLIYSREKFRINYLISIKSESESESYESVLVKVLKCLRNWKQENSESRLGDTKTNAC